LRENFVLHKPRPQIADRLSGDGLLTPIIMVTDSPLSSDSTSGSFSTASAAMGLTNAGTFPRFGVNGFSPVDAAIEASQSVALPA
jgi:hypothetical protein